VRVSGEGSRWGGRGGRNSDEYLKNDKKHTNKKKLTILLKIFYVFLMFLMSL